MNLTKEQKQYINQELNRLYEFRWANPQIKEPIKVKRAREIITNFEKFKAEENIKYRDNFELSYSILKELCVFHPEKALDAIKMFKQKCTNAPKKVQK